MAASKDKDKKEDVVLVTDIGTALNDINKRASERKKFLSDSNEKVIKSKETNRAKKKSSQSLIKISGLKGLGDYGK